MESQNLHQHTLPHLQRILGSNGKSEISTLVFLFGALIHRLLLVVSLLIIIDYIFIYIHTAFIVYLRRFFFHNWSHSFTVSDSELLDFFFSNSEPSVSLPLACDIFLSAYVICIGKKILIQCMIGRFHCIFTWIFQRQQFTFRVCLLYGLGCIYSDCLCLLVQVIVINPHEGSGQSVLIVASIEGFFTTLQTASLADMIPCHNDDTWWGRL